MAKKLIVNCGECDARTVSEETLSAYERVEITAGTVIVTKESKNILNRGNVSIKCGEMLELESGVTIKPINGTAQIKSTDAVSGRVYLEVNGSLEIGAGTETILQQYAGIRVNGTVSFPESMGGYLGMLAVNGSTECYPDGAVVLKRNAVIDKLFALRARDRLYWSPKRMVMVDPELDVGKLAAKGAQFSAKEVIITASKVEEMVELIDEQAQITVVPDGTRVITDDVELTAGTLKRYGKKLYILGDLEVSQKSGEALEALEYLNIQGDVSVDGKMEEKLLEKAEHISGDVAVIRGRCLRDKMAVSITSGMLEQEMEGVSVCDCMKVMLDAQIPAGLIRERLSIRDCMEVFCTPEQEAAVAMVCEDVNKIGAENKAPGAQNGKDDPDIIKVNTGKYVL